MLKMLRNILYKNAEICYIKRKETYCVICKKNNANKNSIVRNPKQNKFMLLSSYAVCGKKKLRFIKNKTL